MDIDTINTPKIFNLINNFPKAGSEEERNTFNSIQKTFIAQFEKIFPDKLAPRTVVILPSLTLDTRDTF